MIMIVARLTVTTRILAQSGKTTDGAGSVYPEVRTDGPDNETGHERPSLVKAKEE